MLKTACILLFIVLILGIETQGQDEQVIKSLQEQLRNADNDSVRSSVTNELGRLYRKSDPIVAEDYAHKSIEFANKTHDKVLQGNAYQLLGVIKKYQGDLRQALALYEKSRTYFVEAGDKKGEANIINNIGVVHKNLGNLDSALACYKTAVAIFDSVGFEEGVAKTYMNIGVVMKHQAQYDLAVEYYLKSLDIYEKGDNKSSIAKCYNNLGVLYRVQKFLNKALESYRKSIAISEQLGNNNEIGISLAQMANVYMDMDSVDRGLEYMEKAKALYTKMGYKNGIALIAMNEGVVLATKKQKYGEALKNYQLAGAIFEEMGKQDGIIDCKMYTGQLYSFMGKHDLAISNITDALELAKSIGAEEARILAYKKLAFAYARKNDYKAAYKNYEAYHELQDSLMTGKAREKMAELTEMYDHEKKERLIKEAEAKLALAEAENAKKDARQQLMLWVSGLIILMFLVAAWALVVNRNKNKKLAARNLEISDKNLLIEAKNKDILDSIQYAKRLQDAILPTDEMIREIIPGFVLFKPKDIVSGDFYWIDKVDDIVLFGVFDCTGHGVPGAFMSIIGYNGINQAVNEQGMLSPEKIMDHLNVTVANTLRQSSGTSIKVRDGMDTALCSVDLKKMLLKFSGAMNPMYLVRNGEIEIFKGDKQPVGAVEANKQKSYTSHEVNLQKGDCIYLFSDGYVDQFGGENDKKYKLKRFRQLLRSIWQKPMQEQHAIIDETFHNWKGTNDQLDDVCVVGVRI